MSGLLITNEKLATDTEKLNLAQDQTPGNQ